ncbi:inversin-B-like [Haliotis cracherodii]|uniref:inversin-B-like n=1 Tax=Haliotis cracherodii TaxID=6455 RepID=UPI0039EC2555
MVEEASSSYEESKSKFKLKVTLDTDELEFEIKYKDNPTWTHTTTWNCEVVPATLDLPIHKELYTIKKLQKTFDDSLHVTLTSIRTRKRCMTFVFGHNTPDDAVQMCNKFAEVKQRILNFTQEIDARMTSINLRCSNTATPTPARTDPQTILKLRDASRWGYLADVKRILEAGQVDVNCLDRCGWTPVMWAAKCGHREVVELLVNEGADVSLVNDDGDNTLHFACMGGDVETVKFVLSQNVRNVNSRGRWSRTPVVAAAENGRKEVIEVLVSDGADVSLVDDNGNNILHWACAGGDVETVKFVLSQNIVDINARNEKGQTASDTARLEGRQEVETLLVSHGAR